MNGSGSLRRLVARGLMLVAALVAVCAFHSSSEPTDQPAASSVAASTTVDLVGPFHLDPTDVPSTHPSVDPHAHLAVACLLALTVSLVLLALVSRVRRTVAVRPRRDPARSVWGLSDRPWPAPPSLSQLQVSRT
ncbi:DUF6153 family protein [Kribbella sp. NBC_00482]|uniref:DUF6153 family protein n=1 Tax=Kribbella sp. NBC_00482 TaxID=2975968 RepID=UPI002E185F4F